MTVKIKYFASLRESIGRDQQELMIEAPMTASNIWQQATGQDAFPDNTLIAINHAYVDPESLVNDGDEVAYFPPVTGG